MTNVLHLSSHLLVILITQFIFVNETISLNNSVIYLLPALLKRLLQDLLSKSTFFKMGVKAVLVSQIIVVAFLLSLGTPFRSYPYWQCHPGWNDSKHGTDLILDLMRHCVKPRFPYPDEELDVRNCKKTCMYYHLQILEQRGSAKDSLVVFTPEEKMAEQLRLRILTGTGGNESAYLIAHRIHSECSELLNSLSGQPCTEWSSLEGCIEYAWGCQNYEAYENANATMKEVNVEESWEDMGNRRN